MRLYPGALPRPARGTLAAVSIFSSIAIAEKLGTELPNPQSALGRIAGCQRTYVVSLSKMDTEYGDGGSDHVGGGGGNSDGGGGGSGAG